MGGKFSHEFMVPADTGENEVVYCDGCGYAANIDKAQSGSGILPEEKSNSNTPQAQGASGILPEETSSNETFQGRLPEKFATPDVLTRKEARAILYGFTEYHLERRIRSFALLARRPIEIPDPVATP